MFSIVFSGFSSPEGLGGSFNSGFSHGSGFLIVLYRTCDVKESNPHSPEGQALDACCVLSRQDSRTRPLLSLGDGDARIREVSRAPEARSPAIHGTGTV